MATVERDGSAATATRERQIAVENPATGETIAHVPDMDTRAVAEIVARARAAQAGWAALGYDGRAERMLALRRWVVDNRARLIDTIVEETGKTREDALAAEVVFVADSLGFWAKRAKRYLADERVRPHSPMLLGKKLYVRYRPYGVVGVIGPWNYPLTNSFGDCIPALMAGNAVVLKPSEVTPLTSLLIEQGARAAGFPDQVFSVATGAGETGAALVDAVDMIMFTGSTATGKKVMGRAAETLTPVSLELGGKDPMVVLRDADLERAANAAVWSAMTNGGQVCISTERVYVEEPAYDEFVGKVVDKVRALRQGPPTAGGAVEVGAVTFPPQAEIVERHLRDAVDKGAKIELGGRRREGQGRFFEPTVVTGVDHTMALMTEETFGPVLPIMKVRDADEAIRLANDTRYGLDSSIWTKDVARGEQLAARMTAGATCVNDALVNYLAQELPFGGTGESGIGVRHGADGIRKYCSRHSVLVTRFGFKRELYMYPYSKWTAKVFEKLLVLQHGRGPRGKGGADGG